MARLASVNGAMAMLANPGFAKAMQQMGAVGARTSD
jgi:phenylalanine-4-hydroxylase